MKLVQTITVDCAQCGMNDFHQYCGLQGCPGKLYQAIHADFSKERRKYTRGVGEWKFASKGGMYWRL